MRLCDSFLWFDNCRAHAPCLLANQSRHALITFFHTTFHEKQDSIHNTNTVQLFHSKQWCWLYDECFYSNKAKVYYSTNLKDEIPFPPAPESFTSMTKFFWLPFLRIVTNLNKIHFEFWLFFSAKFWLLLPFILFRVQQNSFVEFYSSFFQV